MIHPYAIVFPGQGSQSVGMLADIAQQYSEVQQAFTEASDILSYDLWHLVQHGPAEELDRTMHTQPALLVASYAIWNILQSRFPLQPKMVAGHSLGEYTALVCAKSLSFVDAVKLVAARGQYMQDAVPADAGAMAAIIGLEDSVVHEICKQAIQSSNEILSPANYNSIGQIVIAGDKAAVMRAMTIAKEKGAKMAILLPVSVPSHCALMRPAAERLAKLLNTISFATPAFPIVNNVDVTIYKTAEQIRDGLVRQLYSPVRWVETIQAFISANISQVIECGPGKVLTGLNKRIDKKLQLMCTENLASMQSILSGGNQDVA